MSALPIVSPLEEAARDLRHTIRSATGGLVGREPNAFASGGPRMPPRVCGHVATSGCCSMRGDA